MNPKKSRTNCLSCGRETDRHNTKYCSNLCQHIHDRALRAEVVLATGDVSSAFKGVRSVKNFILEQDGPKCSICGTLEWNGKPVPLVLDHVDGNSENCLRSNLRLVCGNCDMQLPTYKSRNRGNGRHNRRQRYANGQSY